MAEDKVDEFIQKLVASYPAYKGLEGEALSQVVFATKPSSGACGALFRLSQKRCIG